MMRMLSLLSIICLMGGIMLAGCGTYNHDAPDVGELIEFDYYPGYGDMEGGRHSETLRKNDDGEWVIECCDQETFNSPTVITTYALAVDAKELESFIKDKKVLALTARGDSDLFATDYHPWSYSIIFDNSSLGGKAFETYSIEEYKEYSDNDIKLLNELREKFRSLRGEVIAETVEGGDEVLSEEQALSAIRNYCLESNPDLENMVSEEDYPIYWEVESGDEDEIVILYRSYTGALVSYYIDPESGDTYVTEFVQGITDEEERTDEEFNAWDYLDQ